MKRQGDKDSPSRSKRSKGRSPSRRTYNSHSSPHYREDRYASRRTAYDRSADSHSSPPRTVTSPSSRRGGDRRKENKEQSRGGYRVLLVRNFSSQISDFDIEESLYYEYKKFGDVSVRVAVNSRGERVAHATFRSTESASAAKNAKGHLVMYDRRLSVEAVYEKKETRVKSPSPLPSVDHRDSAYRSSSKKSPGHRYEEAPSPKYRTAPAEIEEKNYPISPNTGEPESNLLPEDDPYATRTLFLGNLEPDISTSEVRRCFDLYGRIEDIDIKRAQRGVGSYAFIRFANLDMAYEAKVAMQGKAVFKSPMRIGYGKVVLSSKLWVGGLGPWTSLSTLEREFDRFGAIRKIDYEKGTSFAYMLYETIDAAQAACAQMRGSKLPGSDIRLRIDFAEPDPGMPGYDAWLNKNKHEDSYDDRSGHSRYPDRNATDRGKNSYRHTRGREKHGDRGSDRQHDYRERDGHNDSRSQDAGHRSPGRHGRRTVNDRRPGSPNRTGSPVNDRPTHKGHEFERRYVPAPSQDVELNVRRKQTESANDLHELCQVLNPPCWDGAFVLKKTAFAVRFFLLDGDIGVINNLITTITAQGLPARISFLHITQRLRQDDDKLRDVSRRLKDPNCKTCLLLAVPGLPSNVSKADSGSIFTQQRPLRGLVKYFKDKDAAGVVAFQGPNPIPDAKKEKITLGMLHAFPPGQFANDHLFSLARSLQAQLIIEEYMIIVVARGSSP